MNIWLKEYLFFWHSLFKPYQFYQSKKYASLFNTVEKSPFTPAQRKAIILNDKNSLVIAGAGTGKTSSVLWSADYLMELGLIKRVLIICPLSIMYSAWQGDVFNTCMHRTSAVCHGTATKRKKIVEGEYEFVIINYDGVGVIASEIKSAKGTP